MQRAQADIAAVKEKVAGIINDVRTNGDAALVKYTKMWDTEDFTAEKLRVTKEDIERTYENVAPNVLEQIKAQIALAKKFHEAQRVNITDWEAETAPGILVGEKWTPIEAVGLYIPGGKNPFPTVQQILALPAKIAGCPRIVASVSPGSRIDEVLVAAAECGVDEIYRVGGAQAIAAMAYGTETIQPVNLIAGPGNPFVTAAKVLCQEKVAIDMPAGPSEAIMLADEYADPRYCAADILARAEHGPDSAGVLVTDSDPLAEQVQAEVEKQFRALSRQEYVREALGRYSAIIVTETWDDALSYVNAYAPEHVELLVQNPRETLDQIVNAGSVFLGPTNPVATGDYASGVNHILPTGGWAKMTSPVGVWTFMKRVQYSEVSEEGLRSLQPIVDTIADVEGLDAHRKSVDIRLED